MTINKAIKILMTEDFNGYSISEIIEARNLTLDIVKKYQKIEKIIKNAGIFAFDVPVVRRIAEVIKDE